jgi:multiple antibiotic resistance protein
MPFLNPRASRAGISKCSSRRLLAGDAGHGPKLAAIIAIVRAACWLCLLCFISASLIGRTGNAVLSRGLGMPLAAYSVQLVINGITAVRASFS